MNRLNKEGHVVEEINGVRCSIVEKNATPERVEFLKKLLEANGYTVMIAQVAAPKPPPPKPVPAGEVAPPPPAPLPAPDLWNIGVTDILFHAMLAVYERVLKTPEGKLCTISYFNQEPEKENWYWKST